MDYSKATQMLKFQQEAMKVKKELDNTKIESEVDGLVITVNWEMKVEKVDFETLDLIPGLNKDQKEEYAAEKMQGIMGQMWMWDLMNQLGWMK